MEFSAELLEFMKYIAKNYDDVDKIVERFSDFGKKHQNDPKQISLIDFMVFLAKSYNRLLKDLIDGMPAAMLMVSMMFNAWEANRLREKMLRKAGARKIYEDGDIVGIELPLHLLKKAKATIDKLKSDEDLFEHTVQILREKSNLPEDMIEKTVRQFFDEVRNGKPPSKDYTGAKSTQ